MILDVTTTLSQHWTYVAEGGSSIVFSYTGPSSPHFDGTVLRLRKISHEDRLDIDTFSGAEEPDDPTVVFQHEVIQRLIPPEHLPRLESALVSRPWLEELKVLSEEKRPSHRRANDTIDVNRTKAVLATDLVGGKALAIEIKPKWGFMPSPVHLPSETRLLKTTTCRFCMHSHLKFAEGEEVSLGYCPLDLYSRDETRVTKALHTLWDVWIGSSAAVNNLRIFVDGQIIMPTTRPSSLAPLARYLHAGTFDRDTATVPSLETLRASFTAVVLPLLLGTPVLSTLSRLQRTLDSLDIEGLSVLWSWAHRSAALQVAADDASIPPLGSGFPEPTLADWQTFLDIYLAKHAQMDHEHPDSANIKYYCMAYLLSASFKDCSIILRIPQQGAATVSVIDLDVKSVDRLSKWAKLDRKIVETYNKVLEPANCIDDRL